MMRGKAACSLHMGGVPLSLLGLWVCRCLSFVSLSLVPSCIRLDRQTASGALRHLGASGQLGLLCPSFCWVVLLVGGGAGWLPFLSSSLDSAGLGAPEPIGEALDYGITLNRRKTAQNRLKSGKN